MAASWTASVEHTCLRPETLPSDIERLADEAKRHRFFGVCVNGCYVALAKRRLEGSELKTVSVIGFPLGSSTTATKVFETACATEDGADEIDMVMNIGAFLSGDHRAVFSDIHAVVGTALGRPVKVILETAKLSDEQKRVAARLSEAAGAAFVKTSTGFGGGGATASDVRLLKETVGPEVGVKASGGVRTLSLVRELIDAGASRIGTSSALQML